LARGAVRRAPRSPWSRLVQRFSSCRWARARRDGQPAVVFWREERPFAAILVAVADGKIQRVFFHADLGRLRYLGHGRQTH